MLATTVFFADPPEIPGPRFLALASREVGWIVGVVRPGQRAVGLVSLRLEHSSLRLERLRLNPGTWDL